MNFKPLAFSLLCAVAPMATPAFAQDVNFGNDDGEWARDGECDDRRFVGPGMASGLSWVYVGMDATDCRAAYDAGQVRLWNSADSHAATTCAAIDFGNDLGAYPQDGECDDIRFEGPSTASSLDPANLGGDATDCTRLCAFGVISLRDY